MDTANNNNTCLIQVAIVNEKESHFKFQNQSLEAKVIRGEFKNPLPSSNHTDPSNCGHNLA